MRAVDLIAKKRDGGAHDAAEIRFLVAGHLDGSIGDEQMAAWLMAVVWRGLDHDEIDALCAAMVDSGDVVDLAGLGRMAVDKHSTGGVGDKVTLALAPLVAACEVPFAKMSGRGLGHTGGTLDKLEAIPGFRVACEIPAFVEQVARVGCAVVAQSEHLVPADRLLYALRDVTATVAQPGLIATSVMSKKIAAGAGAIVLDVKVGEGAFVRTVEEGRELARLMQGLGERAGRRVVCELTRMDEGFRARWEAREQAIRSTTSSAETTRPPRRKQRVAAASFRVEHHGEELEFRAHDPLPDDLSVDALPAWAWREA